MVQIRKKSGRKNNVRRTNMKRIMTIEGMSCAHCQARVEKALQSISGVEATVNLKKKIALVEADASVTDEMLTKAVEEAGYVVMSMEAKKGLFGK